MSRKVLKMKLLDNGGWCDECMKLPSYETEGSAGMDIRSADDAYIGKGETRMIHTGFALAVPKGYEVQIRSRSGLAKNKGVFVTNGIGTIDSDYRGEVCVLLTCLGIDNDDDEGFDIRRGDRIAQMVLMPVEQAELELVGKLDETDRGDGGFGSTGS